jgi:uncharacterized repeat protein (TIGR01451 family)
MHECRKYRSKKHLKRFVNSKQNDGKARCEGGHRRVLLPFVVVLGVLWLATPCRLSAQPLQYGYDTMGRLTHVGNPDGSSIDCVYDNLGNRLIQTTTVPGGPSNQPPTAVTNPSVPNGVTNASTTPVLSWNAVGPKSSNVLAYYIYFGTSPSPPLVYSGFATNWSPGQLRGFTTYYWQVVARDNYNAQTASPIWSFTTSNQPPVANFAVSVTNGWAPLSVIFSDQSTSSDGSIVAWQWMFNNNGIVVSTSRNPTLTFTNGGEYTVSLTVQDNYGAVGTITKTNLIGVFSTNIIGLAPISLSVDLATSSRLLTVQYSISNQGTVYVSGNRQYADIFYVSTNSVLDASATQIAIFYENQPLPPGFVYSRTNSVTIPSGVGTNYYLLLKTDGYNQLDEINPANTVTSIPLNGEFPDLVAGNISVVGIAASGQSGLVTYSVTNEGALGVNGQWTDSIYLSTNSSLDSSAMQIGSVNVNQALSTGSSYTITNAVTFPTWPVGSYYLILVVDGAQSIAESNYGNNTNVAPISLVAPDLAPVSLTVPVVGVAGGVISLVCVVTNQGAGGAQGAWYDTIWGSTNPVFTGSATYLSETHFNSTVSNGGSYSWTNTVTIPASLTNAYYLFVVVDDPTEGPVVYETTKTNNTSAGALINVVPNLPGIAIAEDAAPNPIVVLSNLTCSISIINRGASVATGVVVTDPLPADFSFISALVSQGAATNSGALLTWNVGTMSNGVVVTASFVVRPNVAGVFTNSATVSWSTGNPSTNTNASAVITVVQNPTGPLLQIALVGANVSLFWSTNDVGYVLQSTLNLAATNQWAVVTNVPTIVGNSFYVTNAVSNSTKFYRLSQ